MTFSDQEANSRSCCTCKHYEQVGYSCWCTSPDRTATPSGVVIGRRKCSGERESGNCGLEGQLWEKKLWSRWLFF